MTDYILYHQVKPGVDCPDGIVAAWVASKVYPNAQIVGCVYQQTAPIRPANGDSVVIVDFSFPAETLIDWKDNGAVVTLIDHHKTAKEMLGGLLTLEHWLHFNMDECGATLAWKTFFPGVPMPTFLGFVRSRDLWLDCDLFANPIPETLIAHEALSGFRFSLGMWARDHGVDYRSVLFAAFDELAEMSRDEYLDWARLVALDKLHEKRRKCSEIAANHWLPQIKDFDQAGSTSDLVDPDAVIPVCSLPSDGSQDRYTSDVCMVLYRQFPQAPFVACITSDGTWSLRSDKDGNNTDVGEIAARLGGGGHRNASGFRPSP